VRRVHLVGSLLLFCACSPSWTSEWLGEWTLANGRSDESCDGVPSPSQSLPSASLRLTIKARDNQSLDLRWEAMVNGAASGECDQTAELSEPTRANLLSQACPFSGRAYYVTEGSLTMTESKALELQWVAVVPSGRSTCRQQWQALLVASGSL